MFDDEKTIAFEQLPEVSKKFIQKHFNKKDVVHSQLDRELFSKSYEVSFADGSKIEFDRKGEWDNVNCLKKKIPDGIVPEQITDYVKKNHPNAKIVKIDRERKDFEIELENGTEIKFDKNFEVIDYDN